MMTNIIITVKMYYTHNRLMLKLKRVTERSDIVNKFVI